MKASIAITSCVLAIIASEALVPPPYSTITNWSALTGLLFVVVWILCKTIPALIDKISSLAVSYNRAMDTLCVSHKETLDKLCEEHREDRQSLQQELGRLRDAINNLNQTCAMTRAAMETRKRGQA